MTSTTLIAMLVRLTNVLAVAGAAVIFGFLYVLAVQPERAAARRALQQLAVERAHLAQQRTAAETPATDPDTSALVRFDARTAEHDRARDVAEAVIGILNGPAVGDVSNISVETGAPADGRLDPQIGHLARPVAFTPVTVSFDAPFERVGRFLSNLRGLPTTFELRSLELARGREAQVHIKAVLFVFHRQIPVQPVRSGRP